MLGINAKILQHLHTTRTQDERQQVNWNPVQPQPSFQSPSGWSMNRNKNFFSLLKQKKLHQSLCYLLLWLSIVTGIGRKSIRRAREFSPKTFDTDMVSSVCVCSDCSNCCHIKIEWPPNSRRNNNCRFNWVCVYLGVYVDYIHCLTIGFRLKPFHRLHGLF